MAELTFQDLEFRNEKETVKVFLYKQFFFEIPKQKLERISSFSVKRKSILFKDVSEKSATNKFNILISEGIANLKSVIGNKKAVYVHKNSGIPLIGSIYFGLVDRNTTIIDVRPITGCNLNCIYCSVDEGTSSRKKVDFVVEEEYLVEEFMKLVAFKNTDKIEAHIGPQGEPLLYSKLVDLVQDLSSIKEVCSVSVDTNGTLLTTDIVDALVDAGLTRFNISINSLDKNTASKLSDSAYPVNHVKEMCRYIAGKCDITLAPVWVPGFNDDDIEEIVKFAKEIKTEKTKHLLGIQNFMSYPLGRNPGKSVGLDIFLSKLKALEKVYGEKLILEKEDYDVRKTKELPKPFLKGEMVKSETVCEGRIKEEMIAVLKNRCISVPNCFKQGKVKLKITRDKHNIFVGQAA